MPSALKRQVPRGSGAQTGRRSGLKASEGREIGGKEFVRPKHSGGLAGFLDAFLGALLELIGRFGLGRGRQLEPASAVRARPLDGGDHPRSVQGQEAAAAAVTGD